MNRFESAYEEIIATYTFHELEEINISGPSSVGNVGFESEHRFLKSDKEKEIAHLEAAFTLRGSDEKLLFWDKWKDEIIERNKSDKEEVWNDYEACLRDGKGNLNECKVEMVEQFIWLWAYCLTEPFDTIELWVEEEVDERLKKLEAEYNLERQRIMGKILYSSFFEEDETT
ncbi:MULTISPECIES: hypothetical protein [unclassified Prochlorococcus]|uniref:hypothetical protein n=1 Tax=unclassified Prochlorococcus TaxID=2627481 RepID=UPI00053381C4|nr:MULTISPECIES: hypothetical protein [unclassified Prochlorococcus]KGG14837.1 hypothetical protein EV06_1900 [Prochlorococcus sp. MIT 0602]KGG15730.1 hypothetical protein EV07_1695 [Prochlorococcus sp. MIT 0603]